MVYLLHMNLFNPLLVAAGGATGSVLRYGVYVIQARWLSLGFPYATLIVNVIGSFVMGLCSTWLLQRSYFSHEMRLIIMVGLLGGFTTFSTFSLDSLRLLQAQHYGLASLNVISNVGFCLLAAALGAYTQAIWVHFRG